MNIIDDVKIEPYAGSWELFKLTHIPTGETFIGGNKDCDPVNKESKEFIFALSKLTEKVKWLLEGCRAPEEKEENNNG